MADTAEKALALAPPLQCPEWCTKDVTNDDGSIVHMRMYPEDRSGRIVLLGQGDEPALYHQPPCWIREDASISIVHGHAREFDVYELNPRQAYALAALIGALGSEHIATALLDAVLLVEPELDR